MPAAPTRRAVLAAGLVGLAGLAGCTDDGPGGSRPGASTSPTVTADAATTANVVAGKRAILQTYDAVSARHPELAALLAPYAADHAAHLAALGSPVPTPASPSTTGAPRPTNASSTAEASGAQPDASATTPGAPPSVSVPDQPGPAVAALVAQERAASATRLTQVEAVSAALARLLGSIGACEAVHVALLPTVLDEALA